MTPIGPYQGIAFVGDYLPRACGIATFTHDLAEAVAPVTGSDQPVIVVAMNDRPEGYAFPDRVKFEVRQDYQIDSLNKLAAFCAEPKWIDRWEAPDWPVAAQAMAEGAEIGGRADLAALGSEMIEQLRRETSDGTVFFRRGENRDEEELPTTAATRIAGVGTADDEVTPEDSR